MLSSVIAIHSYVNVHPMGSRVTPMQQRSAVMSDDATKLQAAGLAAALVLAGTQGASAGPFTRSDIASLTYEQIKGTGLANTCPKVETGPDTNIKLSAKSRVNEFCLEPTSFQVLEDKLTKQGIVTEAVNTKVTTRQTYVLTGLFLDPKGRGTTTGYDQAVALPALQAGGD